MRLGASESQRDSQPDLARVSQPEPDSQPDSQGQPARTQSQPESHRVLRIQLEPELPEREQPEREPARVRAWQRQSHWPAAVRAHQSLQGRAGDRQQSLVIALLGLCEFLEINQGGLCCALRLSSRIQNKVFLRYCAFVCV